MAEHPSASEFRRSIEDLLSMEEESERNGRSAWNGERRGEVIVVEPRRDPVALIGDIHGDYETFKTIVERLEAEGRLDRGLTVFTGDYVDRGPPSGQALVLHELATLKKSLSDRLILLRGNHEPPPGLTPYPHDYPAALERLYGGSRGVELYRLSSRLFNRLPHALVIDNIALVLHGGPPTSGFERGIMEYLGWDRDLAVIEEILWNDPAEAVEYRSPSPRGAGWLWGATVTEKALRATRTKLIVRAHEPVETGYKLNHGGRVVTLFSRRGHPYYNLRAAYLACDTPGELVSSVESCARTV